MPFVSLYEPLKEYWKSLYFPEARAISLIVFCEPAETDIPLMGLYSLTILVLMLITPKNAPLPYITDIGPRTTSIRSMASTGRSICSNILEPKTYSRWGMSLTRMIKFRCGSIDQKPRTPMFFVDQSLVTYNPGIFSRISTNDWYP